MAEMTPTPPEALTTCTNAKADPLDMPKMLATIEGLNLDALVLWFRERAVLHEKFGEAADAITKLRAAQPVEVTPDDEALNVHRFSINGRPLDVDGEYEFVKAPEVRRHIAGLRAERGNLLDTIEAIAVKGLGWPSPKDPNAVWPDKPLMSEAVAALRTRAEAAEAALRACRDKTIEECEAKIMARREQWKNAGGFDGHAAAAQVMLNEVRALKKEPTDG